MKAAARNNVVDPLEQGAALVAAIWAEQPRAQFFCLAAKSESGLFREEWFEHADLDLISDVAREYEAQRNNLYFCTHGFRERTRRIVHAVASSFLWSDLDAINPSSCVLRPSIAWMTSPRRYAAVWRIDAPLLGRSMRNAINNKIMHGDRGGGCLTKLLRFPHSKNFKYRNGPRGAILWSEDTVHKLDEVLALLPPPPPAVRKQKHRPASTTPHKMLVGGEARPPVPAEIRERILQTLRRRLASPTAWDLRDRSWTLYDKIFKQAMRVGLDDSEIAQLVRGSELDKFRSVEDLRADIARSRVRLEERGELR